MNELLSTIEKWSHHNLSHESNKNTTSLKKWFEDFYNSFKNLIILRVTEIWKDEWGDGRHYIPKWGFVENNPRNNWSDFRSSNIQRKISSCLDQWNKWGNYGETGIYAKTIQVFGQLFNHAKKRSERSGFQQQLLGHRLRLRVHLYLASLKTKQSRAKQEHHSMYGFSVCVECPKQQQQSVQDWVWMINEL